MSETRHPCENIAGDHISDGECPWCRIAKLERDLAAANQTLAAMLAVVGEQRAAREKAEADVCRYADGNIVTQRSFNLIREQAEGYRDAMNRYRDELERQAQMRVKAEAERDALSVAVTNLKSTLADVEEERDQVVFASHNDVVEFVNVKAERDTAKADAENWEREADRMRAERDAARAALCEAYDDSLEPRGTWRTCDCDVCQLRRAAAGVAEPAPATQGETA